MPCSLATLKSICLALNSTQSIAECVRQLHKMAARSVLAYREDTYMMSSTYVQFRSIDVQIAQFLYLRLPPPQALLPAVSSLQCSAAPGVSQLGDVLHGCVSLVVGFTLLSFLPLLQEHNKKSALLHTPKRKDLLLCLL